MSILKDAFDNLSDDKKEFLINYIKDDSSNVVCYTIRDGDIGEFLRKYGNDVNGKSVEEIVNKFVHYLGEKS